MNGHVKDAFRYQYLYAYGNRETKSVLSGRYQNNVLDRKMADEYWAQFNDYYPAQFNDYYPNRLRWLTNPCSEIAAKEPEYKPVNLDDYL